jgi:hypothetical protein
MMHNRVSKASALEVIIYVTISSDLAVMLLYLKVKKMQNRSLIYQILALQYQRKLISGGLKLI